MNNVSLDGVSLYELALLLKKLINITKTKNSRELLLITPDLDKIRYAIYRVSSADIRESFNKFIECPYGYKALFVIDYKFLRRKLFAVKIKAIVRGIPVISSGIALLFLDSVFPLHNVLPIDILLYIKIIY